MRSLVFAGEIEVFVIGALDDGSSAGQHAVDVFDVGGAPPTRQQRTGGGAAVLVGEDDGIDERLPVSLAIHEQRDVGELADGVLACVEDRSSGDDVRVVAGHFAEAGSGYLKFGAGRGELLAAVD